MAIRQKIYTAKEFWEFVNSPENQGKRFERIQGGIVEMSPSNPYSSAVANLIAHYITAYVLERKTGYVTGEQGGYDLPGENTYAPDVGYISKERQAELPRTGFNPIPPDLAVEVVSPGNTANEVQQKTQDYLNAGTRIVWVVYPDLQSVTVHTPEGAKTLEINDTLDGGEVLPGFKLPVKNIFEI